MINDSLKIGVCSRSFSRNKVLRAELLQKFSNVKFNDEGLSLNGDSLIEFLADCDGAVIALEYISEDILAQLPNLKFIGKYGVGLDKIDFEALDANNVLLGWTPGVNATAVSELTLNLALNIVRNTPESAAFAKQLNWKQVTGKQLSSLTFGVLGYGHVGSKVARLAQVFGAKVLVHDKVDMSAECAAQNIEFVNFDALLQQADLITVHTPGNQETYHLIAEKQIAMMKPGSYIINTARGGIVCEKSILKALDSGHLSAVAFDVLESEPPRDDVFISHENVFVTTHIGGSSEESILAMGRAAIEGLTNPESALNFAQYK